MNENSPFFQEMGRIAGISLPATKGTFFQEMQQIAERPTSSSFTDSIVTQSPNVSRSAAASDQMGSFRFITDSNPPPTSDALGTTFNPTRQQIISERAARTETRNDTQDILAAGGADELAQAEQDAKPGTMETLLNPVFNVLSIGNYTVAGGVQEYLRTGSTWEAFKQAAAEFENALPMLENARARRPGFENILSENGAGRWESMVGGFVLDFLLDPMNLIGAGEIAKGGLTAEKLIKNWGAIVGTGDIANAAKAGARAIGDLPGIAATRAWIRGTSAGEALLKAARGVRKGARWAFVTNPELKDLGPAGERAIQLMDESKARRVFGGDVGEGLRDPLVDPRPRDPITGLLSDKGVVPSAPLGGGRTPGLLDMKKKAELLTVATTPAQQALINGYLDRPELLKQQIDNLVNQGVLHPESATAIKEAASAFKKEYQDIFKNSANRGILDPATQIEEYNFGSLPTTSRSGRVSDKMLADLNVPKMDLEKETNFGTFTGVEGTPGSAYGKTFKTQQQRIMAGMPTETSMGLNFVRRGADYVRQMNNRHLISAVISDPTISAKWVDLNIFKDANRVDELRELKQEMREKGYDLLDVKRGKDVVAAWMMPEEIVSALKKMDEVIKYPDWLVPILKFADGLQSLWKGYAVFSPGFHMRNLYGNVFNNAVVGGVDNPLRYGQALKLQALDGQLPDKVAAGLKRLTGYDTLAEMPLKIVKDGKELTAQELMDAAKIHAGLHAGMSATELSPDLERYLLTSLDRDISKGIDLNKLREAGDKVDPFTRTLLESQATTGRDLSQSLSRWFGNESPHLRVSRAFGQAIENNAKLAHFIDRVAKGDTFEAAGRSVKKVLFDYGNLTVLEKEGMKRLLPFYAWLRNNVPLQLQAIITNPRRYATIPKTIHAIESITPEWNDLPTPDYFQEQYQVQLPLLRNDKPLTLNPNLPFQDVNRMNWKDALSSMTPFAKVFSENLPDLGYSIFLDRNIEQYPGEPSQNFPQISKKTENILNSILPTFGKANRLITAYKRGELPEQLSTELAGIKVNAVDTRRVLRGQLYQKREIVQALKKKMRDQGRIRE